MEVDSVKRFFNEEEWNSFSFYEKKRFANMQKNYEHLQSIGIKASIPQFMLRKKREEIPTCSKYTDKGIKASIPQFMLRKKREEIPTCSKYTDKDTKFLTVTKSRSGVEKEDSEESDLEELNEFEKIKSLTVTKNRSEVEKEDSEESDHEESKEYENEKQSKKKCYVKKKCIHVEEMEEIDCSKQKSSLGKSTRNMISFLIKATTKNLDCLENLFAPSKRGDTKEIKNEQLQRRYPKRNVRKVCYTEEEISSEDDYFYCDVCNREFKEGACPAHGPFLHVADRQVTPGSSPTRAQETCPRFFSVCRSSIKGAGLGIWTELDLPMGLNFGPYEGTVIQTKKEAQQSGYAWEIRRRGKTSHYITGSDNSISNWMRFVNCAPTEDRQNLMAYQFRGNIFYRTYKSVMAYTELLVWYGDEFGADLGLCLSEASENNLGKSILHDSQNRSNYSGEVFQKVNCIRVPNGNPLSSRRWNSRSHSSETYHSGVLRIQACEIGSSRDRQCMTKEKMSLEVLGSVSGKFCKAIASDPRSSSVGTIPEFTPVDLSQIREVDRSDIMKVRTSSGECVAEGDDPTDSTMRWRHPPAKTDGNGGTRKLHQCEECDYVTSQSSHLKRHVDGVHFQRRPHRCRECDYRAQNSTNLRHHKDAVHLWKRSHKCEYCHYESAQSVHLRRHVDTVHLKKRPHKCHLCEYETAHPSLLKEHVNAVHLRRPHKCLHCDHETAQFRNLQRHVKAVHLKIRPFKCQHCTYEASHKSNLQKHLKRIHLKIEPPNMP